MVALTNKSGYHKSDADNMEQMLRELAQRGHVLGSISVKVLVTDEEKIAEVTGVNAADWMKSRAPERLSATVGKQRRLPTGGPPPCCASDVENPRTPHRPPHVPRVRRPWLQSRLARPSA